MRKALLAALLLVACASPLAAQTTPPQPLIWETDIQLPNINCAKCTMQVIQFMAQHGYNQPGGYSYHHCADLQITADPSKAVDKGWPTTTH